MEIESRDKGRTVSLYLQAHLHEAALKRVQELRQSFSGYVVALVEDDLRKHGALPEQMDERETVLRSIETAFTVDELKQLLQERAIANAEAEGKRGAA